MMEFLLLTITQLAVITVILLAVWGLLHYFVLRWQTVLEYQRGLLYTQGRFIRVLEPGWHWYLPWRSQIETVDVRPRLVFISGQELLCADGVTIKISLAANYEIADPNTARNKVQDFHEALYVELQLILRAAVSAMEVEALLQAREALAAQLLEQGREKAVGLGLNLISVSVRDMMLPGKMRDVFASVARARMEGVAALERARGETAALRSLANAARMLNDQPNLLSLRLVQALGDAPGNSLIIEVPSKDAPTAGRAAAKKSVKKSSKKSSKQS